MSHLLACPECDKHLQVPEELIGKKVQCPECKHTFTAALPERDEENGQTRTFTPEAKTKKKVTGMRETGRRSSRRADDDNDDDDRDDDDFGPVSRGGRFRCPFCGSRETPDTRSQISVGGWVVFAVMMFFCFPLFWIGLLMTEEYRVCRDCGSKLGG